MSISETWLTKKKEYYTKLGNPIEYMIILASENDMSGKAPTD
jgi:hypothetical protein